MLKTKLLHPEILMALASNGHGAKVLIADGNFPISTCTLAGCKRVFLNLSPGLVSVIDVLKVIQPFITIESAVCIATPNGDQQPIYDEFRTLLGREMPIHYAKRFEFYEQVRSTDTCLAILTGETRRFANLLLTIGTVKGDE